MIAAGVALAALPLIVIVAFTVKEMGWKAAAGAWGTALILTASIAVGLHLVELGVTQ